MPSINFMQNKEGSKVLQWQNLAKAFIYTKDQLPRNSQDDKSFPEQFEIIHFHKHPVRHRM